MPDKYRVYRETLAEAIDQQPDLVVVGQTSNAAASPFDFVLDVGDTNSDLVVLTLTDSDELPAFCSFLFPEYPHVSVAGISVTSNRAFLWTDEESVIPLRTTTMSTLLSDIRRGLERDAE